MANFTNEELLQIIERGESDTGFGILIARGLLGEAGHPDPEFTIGQTFAQVVIYARPAPERT